MPETVIKKSKQFKQANFLKGFATPEMERTESDKIATLGFCDSSDLDEEMKEVLEEQKKVSKSLKFKEVEQIVPKGKTSPRKRPPNKEIEVSSAPILTPEEQS